MVTSFKVVQDTSARYRATIVDTDGSAIPASSITTLTVKLTDINTGSVINSRNDQSLLNANDGTVDSNGLLSWYMRSADNPIVTSSSSASVESHLAMFTVTWLDIRGVSQKSKWPVVFNVVNLAVEA